MVSIVDLRSSQGSSFVLKTSVSAEGLRTSLELTREEMISKSAEVNPEEELTIHGPIPPQVMGTPDTPERDVVPVNVSPIPVKKWYQIDFNPAAFCKRVFQSVYSEPLTRSDSSSQKTYITGRKESISPPSIQEPIVDLHVQRREAATFVTRIIGFPTPVVSWYKDGKPLSPSKHVKLAENSPYFSLTLVNTGSTDNGFYTCTARNSGGEVSCKAKLTVERDSGGWKHEVRKCSALVKRKRRSLQSLYKIHEEIGRGSFGVVNRVTSRESGKSFAGKFLPMRSGSRSRALNERDLLARVSHPRVACLLDSFCSRQTLVLLTELCSSHTLLDHLLSKALVKESKVGTYIQQVLEGIEHIHSQNILHLDINPSNILMTLEKEEVKICDFGLSQNIDPSRQQYSKYGMPEFVAPEIASQAPVTKGTDIWSLGVLSYLCLTCHCPFSGESDCAILLRVCEGQLSWDTPDVTSRGPLAQDFLHRTLQSEPRLRPTASECLSHEWFQRLHEDNEATDINTKNLTAFISKNRQQRSLTCYGAALVQKTIAEILASTPQETSLVGPRTQQNLDSPSLSSGSSSEYDEIETWATPLSTSLPLNLYKDQDSRCLETENLGPEFSEERYTSEVVCLEKQLEEEPELTSQLRRGDSTSSLCTDDEGSTGGKVSRESLIKSTFYSSSEELSPLSARRMLLQQKKRTKRLERSRVRLRSGFSSGLGEPLLEDMEGSAEEDTGGSQRRGSSQSSAPLTKSCSFDSDPVPYSTVHRQRRSRSLGEYSRRTPSTSELRKSGVEVDVTDTFSSQECLGQDRKNNERVEQSADTISDSHSAIELKEISPKNDKDCMAELVTKKAVEIDVLQLTAGNSTEVGLFEDVQEMTDSVFSPKRFDEGMDCHAVQTGLQEKTEEMGHLQSDIKVHSLLKPMFVESTTPVSVVQDVSELLGSQYGLKLMERPRSMDLLFKALETLEKENRAHFPKIHKSRSDEGIHKPSDLALLAPEPTKRAHSAVCGLSASEEPCGVTSVPSKELDIADITAEIVIKKADSSQELFLNTPHDEELCDSIANVQYSPPEPEVKASGSELDGMVESAEEVYPGLLDDKMSCDYLASSQNSITHLFNRGLEEACGGADAYAGLLSTF
ncbi:hypothetical protein AGOR_G00039970 [Albula goreensis]|uniref:Uncharacterized protein n=1 Tax=Albula goreensis TaxID=1534307 RepID=A0A8T3E148_9TELE|nr:hypothetical protein AGOR_G00039970 [Albula goreensis]